MGLRACPDCKIMISTSAPICPHCARLMKNTNDEMAKGCGCLILLFLALLICYMSSGTRKKGEQTPVVARGAQTAGQQRALQKSPIARTTLTPAPGGARKLTQAEKDAFNKEANKAKVPAAWFDQADKIVLPGATFQIKKCWWVPRSAGLPFGEGSLPVHSSLCVLMSQTNNKGEFVIAEHPRVIDESGDVSSPEWSGVKWDSVIRAEETGSFAVRFDCREGRSYRLVIGPTSAPLAYVQLRPEEWR